MSKTKIEWATDTWNPATGCDRVSPGCDNCYALTMAKRLKAMGSADYQTDGDPKTSGPGFGIAMHPHRLDLPLSWKKPRKVFVNSMSDLFHDGVSDEFIAKVWTVMAATPQHTYQILTKRHARMRSLVRRIGWRLPTTEERGRGVSGSQAYVQADETLNDHLGAPRVLPNVWLGVSVENQQWADIRIPALLNTPAAVRFLSCEPLLGPVDLTNHLHVRPIGENLADLDLPPSGAEACGLPALHWVIVGGESGRGARPMHPDWARSLRDQCETANIPYLFKQHGEHRLGIDLASDQRERGLEVLHDGDYYVRLSKHAAGRELDGRTWDQYPTSTPVPA